MNIFDSLIPKSHIWNLTKGRLKKIDELPLMYSPGPMLTILAVYLVFVLKIGPIFMRKREAYKLTRTMLIYNATQVLISLYLVVRYFTDIMTAGLVPIKCLTDESYTLNRIIIGTYLYWGAKLTELLDTVFFVLRKKNNQVTFLHVYHHSVMFFSPWVLLKYWPTPTVLFIGFLNSLVHVFMYTYYGLSALGPTVAKYLTWKKYMTAFQLIQFVSIIIQYVITVNVSECPPEKGVAIFISLNTVVFLLLFLNFYRKNYNKRRTLKIDLETMPTFCMTKQD